MAQIDTGLGWSAKGEYLFNSTPVLASINNFVLPGYPSLPLPITGSSAADIAAGGVKIVDSDNDEMFAGAAIDNCFVSVQINGTYLSLSFVAPDNQGALVYFVSRNKTTGNYGSVYEGTYWQYAGIVQGTTFYYYVSNFVNLWTNMTTDMPQYPSYTDLLNDLTYTSFTWSKLNAGPAVGCLARWYSVGGLELISPVLISTVPENTVITTDGTTPAAGMTTTDFLYQGVRFYMSLIGGNTSNLSTQIETADLRQFGAAAPSKVFLLIADESFANIIVNDAPDPYGEDPSEPEGGDGEDGGDDPVDEETLPLPAVSGLGFSTIYVPTDNDLYALASYLWSGNLDLDNFLRLFANPMDSILGLSAVPVPLSGTYEPIYLGGQLLQGVTMPRYVGRTAVKVDMGTTTITERWGSYLDYDPYTELSVYLPFIGIKNIKADDVMGKTISLMYNIDILSGACVAYLRPSGGSVLYEWAGQCAMQIPITGNNWDNIFQTAISTAVTLGGAMVAPASAPMLAGSVASAAVQAVAAKPRVERSGAVTGVTGFLGQLRPYIIRVNPEPNIPEDQNKYIGYPSYVSVRLGNLSGYNEIATIHLENIPATGDELTELESILKGGVIF